MLSAQKLGVKVEEDQVFSDSKKKEPTNSEEESYDSEEEFGDHESSIDAFTDPKKEKKRLDTIEESQKEYGRSTIEKDDKTPQKVKLPTATKAEKDTLNKRVSFY